MPGFKCRPPETFEEMQAYNAREILIFERRAKRVSFRKIGEELGITGQRVQQIYQAARNRMPAARLADLREEESELIDEMIQELLAIARNDSGKVGNRDRIEAYNSICKWAEARRKLFGLDAPQRKEVTVLSESVVDAALKKAAEDFEAVQAQLEAWEREAMENIPLLEGDA